MNLLGARRRRRRTARQHALHAKPPAISGGGESDETRALQRLVTELLGEVDYLSTELELTRARLEQAQGETEGDHASEPKERR